MASIVLPLRLKCERNSPHPSQVESKFAADYRAGIHKSKYWEPVFEDSINLIAKLPTIAAAIYRWGAGLVGVMVGDRVCWSCWA